MEAPGNFNDLKLRTINNVLLNTVLIYSFGELLLNYTSVVVKGKYFSPCEKGNNTDFFKIRHLVKLNTCPCLM